MCTGSGAGTCLEEGHVGDDVTPSDSEKLLAALGGLLRLVSGTLLKIPNCMKAQKLQLITRENSSSVSKPSYRLLTKYLKNIVTHYR